MEAIVIKPFDLFGYEIRSRSNIEKMQKEMRVESCYIIDMEGISFVSRSVADEFCNMMSIYNIVFENMCSVVKKMIDIVRISRTEERRRKVSDANIIECKDMSSLSEVLLSIR